MRFAARVVRWQRGKERTAVDLQREFRHRSPPKAAEIPAALRRLVEVEESRPLGRLVYTLAPKRGRSVWHLIYTHGGSFVNELVGAHWQIIAKLVRATGATVTVPLYPLAPEHSHRDAFALLEAVYRERAASGAPLVVCGDSAGGNLALVQALRAKELGLPAPAHVILFSPWLDLAMTNPEIAAIQPRDPMLFAGELAECGRWWAAGEDLAHPLLSPVHAELAGLPPVHIFQGADDVLAPDARLLRDRIAAAGGRVEYHETAGAFHDFMGATFTPEARAVFEQIAATLART